MKQWVVFLGGVVTGAILTFIVLAIIGNAQNGRSDSIVEETNSNNKITMFDEPGDVVEDNNLKVFQVIAEDAALAKGQEDKYDDLYLGKVYLLINNDGKFYYDDEIVKAKEGKVFRQVGIYRYPTRNENIKTVPIIMLMDK